MDSDNMIRRHCLKFAAKGVAEQSRIMRKLAKAARTRHFKRHGNTTDSREANLYDWRRKVTLAREARAINLIRGYFKGLTYRQVENNIRKESLGPDMIIVSHLPASVWFPESVIDGIYSWIDEGVKE